MQLPSHQRNLYETSSPSFCVGRKLGDVAQALLWRLLQEAPQCPSRVLVDKAAEQHVVITVSLRHINRWRAAQGLGRGKGRPGQAEGYQPLKSGAEVVRMTPHLSCVGVHLFGRWLDQEGAFAPLTARLTEATLAYREQHPDDDFALLHHRPSTLLQRFLALFFAPLLGIERLSEFDSREHPLQTLIGRSYQSTTLSQFLGQLERVDAAEALMPVLLAKPAGQMIYVDGHMIAYWSRRAMHKGKITMLGRIMAGSQAVIAHDRSAQAVFVAYYPPDIHLSQVILAYCKQVSEATGCRLFVIDRAVNSVALAQAFEAHGLGLLCMLDDNEHAGLESFESILVDTLDDGTKVYSGQWQESRQNDPRRFVMVEPTDDKLLVYWATPKVDKVIEKRVWPRLYRARNEVQELSFKGMIAHGGLDINYGRKTIMAPDRHHQRKQAQLAQSLKGADERLTKKAEAVAVQQAKVAESEARGHGKRSAQRQGKLGTLQRELKDAKAKQAKLAEQAAALGPAGQRADRDFRKQTIMTIRTLFLENMLRAFMAALLTTLSIQVSLEQVLRLLFERRGVRLEMSSQVIYWVNTDGLSLSNRRLLGKIVEGLGAMGLQERGKPIHVRLKAMPP